MALSYAAAIAGAAGRSGSGARARPWWDMNSERVPPTRERALGMVLIAIVAFLAIAGVAILVYAH
jgi:hypothetical protein